jgi:hypothetical protein
VNFEAAVRGTSSIRDGYREGLTALRGGDRTRMSADNPRLLTGSIDLDTTLRSLHPNASRWDYGIGYKARQKSEKVVWVEVHPSRGSSDIQEIEKKARWLHQWLENDGKLLKGLQRQLVWISSGRTVYTSSSPQMRRIAQLGITCAGGRYRIA